MTDRNCCDGLCMQGRSCPYREACTLEDSPHPKRDVVFEVLCWVAGVAALRAALAQQDEPVQEPVQEPVAYIHRQGNHWEVSERFLLDDEKARGWTEEPLYTAPPQRKPLTEDVAALTAQRDALLEALKKMRIKYGEYACRVCDQADAAIKAVEETK